MCGWVGVYAVNVSALSGEEVNSVLRILRFVYIYVCVGGGDVYAVHVSALSEEKVNSVFKNP